MELVLEAEDGRRLTLTNLGGTADNLSYSATLTTETAEGRVGVWEHQTGLPQFIRDLADAWKGFEGVKEYASTEGHLKLACEHDGLGTVICRVAIGKLWDPEWSMSAVLRFGAGAHLEQLAKDTESFFADRA